MGSTFFDVDHIKPGRSGMDPFMQYQMVPFGDRRAVGFMSLADETEDLIVAPASNGAKTFISTFSQMAGPAATVKGLGIVVKPNSAVSLVVEGRNIGRTTLDVTREDGTPVRQLMVAVKPAIVLSYQLCVLSDPIRHLDVADIAPRLSASMLGAEEIWLKAANVILGRIGPVLDVQTAFGLRKPLLLDIFAEGEILRATLATPGVQSVDIFMYATWELLQAPRVGTLGLGDKFVRMGFLDNHTFGTKGAVVAAHEVGHILDLEHPNPLGGDSSLLMDGFGNDRLRMFEIETANPR